MRARNPLYIMAKPPPEVQAQIVALPRNDPGRGPHLLHVTLLTLFDLHYVSPDWLPQVIAALDSFEGKAFPLSFDRIENRKAVTLRSRAPLPEARALQAALVRHLLEQRAPIMDGTTPEPLPSAGADAVACFGAVVAPAGSGVILVSIDDPTDQWDDEGELALAVGFAITAVTGAAA